MALLTVQELEGNIVAVDCTQAGDEYPNNGQMYPMFFNDSPNPIAVTRKVQTQPMSPDACADEVSTIPGSTFRIMKALPPRRYNTTLGRVQITYPVGQASNLRVAIVRIPHAR